MNNFYTLHHEANFLDGRLCGASIVLVLSRKKRLLEFNLTANGSDCQLVFQATSSSALFLQDGMNDSRTNAATVFEDVWGENIAGVTLDSDDRIMRLELSGGHHIQFVLFGPHANAFLYDGQKIVDTFRNSPPPSQSLPYSRGSVDAVERESDTRSRILRRDSRFPRALIGKIIDSRNLGSLPAAELCMVVDSMSDQMMSSPAYRLLSDRTLCLLNESYLPDDGSHSYSDVNALVRSCWVQREIRDKYTSRKNQLLSDLATVERKLIVMASGLSDQSTSAERADQYEKIGHILMANSYLEAPASDTVNLDDVYNPGNQMTIKVKHGVSFSENAQLYYQKAKNTRKTREANKSRLADARSKMSSINSLQQSLLDVDGQRTLERWIKQNESELSSILPGRKSPDGTSRPWRVHQIGNFEVWIGKSASGNDELLQAAHKEDVWLHARHVSGSHVLVRMARSTEFPPNEVIEKAASWAAWHSKAKTAGMVPVIFTKRKYVRKPKGAAPGTALVDKEQVCLIEPSKPPNSIAE